MRRIQIPSSVTHKYQIYPPSGTNGWRVFKIQDGKRTTVRTDKIQAIVQQYRDGTLTKEQTKVQLQLVVEALYKADGVKVARVASNKENEQLFERYKIEVIAKNREAKDQSKESREQAVRRVIRAFGELSILSGDVDDLQDALDRAYPDHRQRQLVVHANSLLKFAGRTEKLSKRKKQQRKVKVLPFDKIDAVLARLPNDAWRVCVQMALYTGCRIGELFALERHHERPDGLFIESQITKVGELTLPKRDKMRDTVVFPEALTLLPKWIKLRQEISLEERARASKIVRSACRRAFPNKPQWHLCFHDLRHSFAVALLEQGVSVDWVAMNIGDSPQVCREHYIGYVQSDNMRAAIAAMLKSKKKLRSA